MKFTTLVLFTLLLVGCDKDLEQPVTDTKKVEVATDAHTTKDGRKIGTTFNFTTRKMGEPV